LTGLGSPGLRRAEGGWLGEVGFIVVVVLMGLLLGGGMVAMLLDAEVRRGQQAGRAGQVRAVVRLVGSADLALSSASRWLRHPSLSEPGAAFADGPAMLDNDPAGAAIGPPYGVGGGDVWGEAVRPSATRIP